MNICLVINSKVVNQTIVFLNSLLLTNPNENFNIYILNSSLTDIEKNRINDILTKNSTIQYIDVDSKKFSNAPILWKTHSKEAYYKLLIPDVIPKSVDKILYFDIDIVINKSIKDLYSIDLKDHYMAAAIDYFVNKQMKDYVLSLDIEPNNYFNSGVVLFNLEAMRKNYSFAQAEEYIAKNGHKFKYHDQEVLNALFNKNTLIIDTKYNSIAKYKGILDYLGYLFFNTSEKDVVIHYAGRKPWKNDFVGKNFKIFYKYSKPVEKELNMSEIIEYRKKHRFYLFLKTIKNVIFP